MKKRHTLKIILNLMIILVWVAMMLLLIRKEGLLQAKGEESHFRELIPHGLEDDIWKSVYISDQWAGYVHSSICPYQKNNRKGYMMTGTSYLQFHMFDQLKDIEIKSVQVLDADYRILKFEIRISGMTCVIITGKRIADHLLVDIMHQKSKYRKVFDSVDDFFLENSILTIYRGKDLRVGDSYTLNLFNPLTLDLEPTFVKVVREEDDYLVLKTQFAGLSSQTWIDKEGRVVREETSNGWILKLETKEEVEESIRMSSGQGVDILSDVAVLTRRKIKDPRRTGYMQIKVTGIDLTDFHFGEDRQRIIDKKEGILEIRAVIPDEDEALPLNDEDMTSNPYLKPSIWIQSRDPKVRSLASDIVKGERNSWLAAKKIGQWVYENIDKSFSVGIPIATSVLANREGDCNEHTVLFVALARACGIPADMCAGFVYIEDGFYYHAWPRVYIGKWVHLDPTFGQSIADATHFELVSGDFSAQAGLALTLGKIQIRILDEEDWENELD